MAMSEAKPTAGNWVAAASPVFPEDGAVFVEADGKVIGGACAHPVDFSLAEREANARIFAAGKDMLAALRALIEVCQTFGVGEDRLPAAIAAMNKAEGQP